MLSYVIRRVLATVPVMAVVALFVFSLLYIAPGLPGPLTTATGAQLSPAADKALCMCTYDDPRPKPEMTFMNQMLSKGRTATTCGR
jgi:ABC-type dipeptide/oligopeptide/nickel transport system permease component